MAKRVKNLGAPVLFDPWSYLGPKRRRQLDQDWPGVFRRLVLPFLPVDEVAATFDKRMGRPSKELRAMLGALVLQQMLDLTDEETAAAFAFDIRWHYALDIVNEDDEAKFVTSRTLRNYRSRVLELRLEQAIFSLATDEMARAFSVDTDRQRLDSTHFVSNIRVLGWTGLFNVTIRNFLRDLRQQPDLYDSLDEALRDRYAREREDGCFGQVKPCQARRTLLALARDMYALVTCFQDQTVVRAWESYQHMARVLHERCEVRSDGEADVAIEIGADTTDDDNAGAASENESDANTHAGALADERVPRDTPLLTPRKTVTGNSLQSPFDPDATYDGHKGQGYQAQIQETFQEAEGEARDPGVPDLILHVSVEPAHTSDAFAVQPAVEDTERRGCKPSLLLADTAYGSDANVEWAKERGVELLAPTPASRPNNEALAYEEFDWDFHGGHSCRCPAGQAALATYETQTGHVIAKFDRAQCAECPLRARCPVRLNRITARLKVRTKKARLGRRRAYEKTPEYRERYRWRAGVEATMSRLKSQTGAARLRVRGMPAVRYTMVLKALGLNILRCSCALKARRRAEKGLCLPLFGHCALLGRSWRHHAARRFPAYRRHLAHPSAPGHAGHGFGRHALQIAA